MNIVYITCGSEKEGKKIAKHLLKKRLIACANILGNVKSLYWWKGRIASEKECLLLGKTRKGKEKKIIHEVKKIHSYELPCIEFIKSKGSREFEQWVKKETK